ncbi:MAG: aminotransferase class I/II-fold pyridoxal phosphate-dependent enzyme [Thermoanaerobaculia bacterium]|nr:aminotransferase class I/II-fold pyridoxal phosphate-dependent enzyme [Thermoanaerobaculia bacterium]
MPTPESPIQPVPFIDLQRFEDGFLDRWAERCAEISAHTQFVAGPSATRLEERLAKLTGAPSVVGCANGTDALQLALRALGIGPGDLVAIPDATFWATFEAVVNVGARVVTVDVDSDDLQLDHDQLLEALDRHRPTAVILVHLYGWGSARVREIRTLCRDRGVHLVEDGAQCFGSTFEGHSIYAEAEVATVSFYPAKVLGACGDAGAVLCSDAELAETVRRLGNHGRTSHYGHGLVGWNSRISGFDAAYLDLCLDYLDERIASRCRAATRYREGLRDLGVRVAEVPAGWEENGYLNVTLHDPVDRPLWQARMKAAGVGYGTVYPGAMSKQPGCGQHLAGAVGGEIADTLCRGVLNLPLFAYITDDEVDRVLDIARQLAS